MQEEVITSNTTTSSGDLENLEIEIPADTTTSKKRNQVGAMVSRFLHKLKQERCGDAKDVNDDDIVSFQPLKQNNSLDTSPPSSVDNDDSPGRRRQRNFLDDTEESSLPRKHFEGFNDNINAEGLTGIEVEIESSCSNDDCLYRRRYLYTLWLVYKRQILLGCAFVVVFLFGVMIGAFSANRGRGSDISSSALKTGPGQECAGSSGDENSSNSTNSGSPAAFGPSSPDNTQTPGETKPPSSETVTVSSITNPAPSFLGPNTFVVDPSMTTAEIQSLADAIFRQQQNNEMGTERYALLFQPGTYGSMAEPLMIQIGYYTEVAGLGATPRDVRIIGKIEVYNRCFEPDPYKDGEFIPTSNSEEGLCFALNSFWRGLSNVSIRIASINQDQCRQTAMFWAISQAASMRRVNIEGGDMSLMDYCSNPAYASGGFIADSKAGKIISGSQQQFITRNSNIAEWSGSVWNQVLIGVTGAPADDSNFPDPAITSLDINPMSREKAYLFVNEAGEYHVHVPFFSTATSDVSWSADNTPGKTIPISSFFVADPSTPVSVMNEQLASGKHLLLTPGVYDISESIIVNRANAVVLGIGIATLTAVSGAIPLKVASQPGIIIAGVTVDAGTVLSPILLQIGEKGDSLNVEGDPNNPITLSDVYFRVGGPHIGKSNICLEINSNHVLVDHTWVWRADHGIEDFDKSNGFDGDNERWATNTGLNGVVVNGNDVTATGLFVEHFQEYNLIWNGERGRVYFFQNELPYEPPSQAEWMAEDGTLGWAAYKIDDSVMEHELWCGGVYCYNRNNPDVVTENGFESPSREEVKLNRVYTTNLSGPGTILNVVNGVGQTVSDEDKGPFYVLQYPQ